jgi:hypothetical protein
MKTLLKTAKIYHYEIKKHYPVWGYKIFVIVILDVLISSSDSFVNWLRPQRSVY